MTEDICRLAPEGVKTSRSSREKIGGPRDLKEQLFGSKR